MTKLGDIGFIGCGTLTEAVVRGMRQRSLNPTIRLSPRSKAVSRRLAAELPGVIRETSNSDVVKHSQIVLLSVRPDQLAEALEGMSFRGDQIVVSFLAKTPVTRIAELVAPAHRVCRVTPLPAIAEQRGPIILFPPLTEVEALFDGLGDIIPAGSEDEIMDLGCASGMMSSFFRVEHALVSWLEDRGVPPAHASLYVRSMFAGLGATALERGDTTFEDLVTGHETPGGLNEHARLHLTQTGIFDAFKGALESVANKTM